jgi:DNA-binding transcriptional MerR regulator
VTSEDIFSSEESSDSAGARAGKSDAAFRTISEVADDLDVPQHVLRFWETKFSQVKPLKRGGGRRYYRPEDVVLLKRIRALLYTDGMTIRGVQKLLRETGAKALSVEPAPEAEPAPGKGRDDMVRLLGELSSLRDELRAALR